MSAYDWQLNGSKVMRKGNQRLPLYILYSKGDRGDRFKSKAVFGMNDVGVCKFWKFLSVHNKLETVDLFFPPPPTSVSSPLHRPHVLLCPH